MHRLAAALAAAFTLLSVTLATGAHAQAWPAKPIRFVVPFGPGSATDNLARIVANELSPILGQPVVIENRAGADGAIGGTTVARAAPDGYTFLFGSNSPLSVVPHMRKEPPYDPLKEFTPITFYGDNTFFVAVHPSVPAQTLAELFAYAKANPGKLNYATGNTYSIVSTAMLLRAAGVRMEAVPYKSEPDAIVDVLTGTVQVFNASATTLVAHVRSGKLRALATTLAERSPLLPDVPSIVETGRAKLPIGPWGAMVGPAGLPADIVARMNKEMVAVLAKEGVKAEMAKHGFVAKSSTPEELAAFLKDQLAVWKVALEEAGIQPQ